MYHYPRQKTIQVGISFCLLSNLTEIPLKTDKKCSSFSVSNQGLELWLLCVLALLIREDKWRNCKSREMKATVAKKRHTTKRRGETLFSHLFYTLSDNGQFVKHSKRRRGSKLPRVRTWEIIVFLSSFGLSSASRYKNGDRWTCLELHLPATW